MLGRVRRPSMSSLEELVLERPSPKIIKDDPFSIYENTLRKLKEGSEHCQNLPLQEAISTDNSRVTSCCSDTIDADCSSSDCSQSNSRICQSARFSKEKRNKNISLLYLYSKYKISRSNPIPPDEEAIAIDNACSPVITSSTLNQSQFTSSSGQDMEKCIDSLVI